MADYETREFSVDELEALDVAGGGRCVVLDEISDHTRWGVVHRVVFLFEGDFFEVSYKTGATEYQETDLWGGADPVIVKRVRPVTISTVSFEPVRIR